MICSDSFGMRDARFGLPLFSCDHLSSWSSEWRKKTHKETPQRTFQVQNGANVSYVAWSHFHPLSLRHLGFIPDRSCSISVGSFRTNLRPHVEQVPHSHVGVALAVAVALGEEFVLGPGHVNPVRTSFRLVIYGGVGSRVAVMDELRLEGR